MIIASHPAPEQLDGPLAFVGGRRVTWSKEAGNSTTKHDWEAGDSNAPAVFELLLMRVLWIAEFVEYLESTVPDTTINL